MRTCDENNFAKGFTLIRTDDRGGDHWYFGCRGVAGLSGLHGAACPREQRPGFGWGGKSWLSGLSLPMEGCNYRMCQSCTTWFCGWRYWLPVHGNQVCSWYADCLTLRQPCGWRWLRHYQLQRSNWHEWRCIVYCSDARVGCFVATTNLPTSPMTAGAPVVWGCTTGTARRYASGAAAMYKYVPQTAASEFAFTEQGHCGGPFFCEFGAGRVARSSACNRRVLVPGRQEMHATSSWDA